MTELDQALDSCLKGFSDQSVYYELFLNTRFYVPVAKEEGEAAAEDVQPDAIAPVLLTEGEGKSSLLLFDTEERLNAWTNGAVNRVILPGHVIIEMTPEDKYLAVNVGTRHHKEFIPAEIAYLKKAVKSIREAMGRGEG